MANNFAAFAEVLIAGEGEYNQAKVGQTELIDRIYKDIGTEAGRIGKTVDVYFPDFGPMTNVGNGVLTPKPVSPNFIPLVFQNREGAALLFQDFEQWQTATDLAVKFFDPLYKRVRESLNQQIANLITAKNFSYNAPINGLKQAEVQVADMLGGWSALADAKVPMRDGSKLHCAVHNNVYRNMIGDAAWTQESLVSAMIAKQARETGVLVPAFNFNVVWDQQMPSASGNIINGQAFPVSASTTVTGANTAFTQDLTTSSYLVFGSDATKTQYQVTAIASDTSLTIGAAYVGTTPASGCSARAITVLTGTVACTTSSATVTGTSTLFTTQLVVGQWLVFSSDTTLTPYQVLSISSATSLALTTAVVAAANGSGQTVTVQSYQNLAFHEYAIALALRPIFTPPEAQDVLSVTYIDLQGIPLRVMVGYQQIYQALMVTVDYGYALAVIRPDFGVLINT